MPINSLNYISDPDIKLIVVLGRCITALERRLFPSIRAAGLTLAQFTVLELLSHGDGLTVNEIINKSFGTSGNTDVVIRNLLKLGWVIKQTDAQDRRIRKIILTKTGKIKITNFLPGHFAEIKELLKCLNDNDKKHLILLLSKLTKTIVTGETPTGNDIITQSKNTETV
jgi:DNA-binding MarR family transcriptional regulator